MPRVYEAKQGSTKREHIDKDKVKSAVYEVIYNEKSYRGVAKAYNMSVMTLKRYVRKKREAIATGSSSPKYELNYKHSLLFKENEELDLSKEMAAAGKLEHGLTPKAARLLAFEFAVKNNINVPENWRKNKIASYDWLNGFMSRHTNSPLRVPEATKHSHATSLNKHDVRVSFSKFVKLVCLVQF